METLSHGWARADGPVIRITAFSASAGVRSLRDAAPTDVALCDRAVRARRIRFKRGGSQLRETSGILPGSEGLPP
jgi:hypothetical protein